MNFAWPVFLVRANSCLSGSATNTWSTSESFLYYVPTVSGLCISPQVHSFPILNKNGRRLGTNQTQCCSYYAKQYRCVVTRPSSLSSRRRRRHLSPPTRIVPGNITNIPTAAPYASPAIAVIRSVVPVNRPPTPATGRPPGNLICEIFSTLAPPAPLIHRT